MEFTENYRRGHRGEVAIRDEYLPQEIIDKICKPFEIYEDQDNYRIFVIPVNDEKPVKIVYEPDYKVCSINDYEIEVTTHEKMSQEDVQRLIDFINNVKEG